jgi:hypothetical protein
MKRSLFFVLAAIVAMQFSGFSQSMGKGKSVFYVGIGAWHGYGGVKYRGYGYSTGSTPTLHLGFEHGVSEAIPQSIIGLGGHLSVWAGHSSFRDGRGNGWNSSWTNVTALFKGFYHHKFLVGEKWDVYASLAGGIRYLAYSYSYTDSEYAIDPYASAAVAPAIGVSLGGRYYVGKTFGFYAEISQGYNVDYAQIGFAFKF